MHCCTIFVAWAKLFINVSTSFIHLPINLHPSRWTLTENFPSLKKTIIHAWNASTEPRFSHTNYSRRFQTLQFRLDSQHRGSHVRGDFWNTHWSVFWRNCVTGSRGSHGHISCLVHPRACAHRIHAPWGEAKSKNRGRIDRTVQSDTDWPSDGCTAYDTLTEWTTYPWRLCAAFDFFSPRLADALVFYAVLGRFVAVMPLL